MASSSAVSQDDLVDNDFEKSNRRSRIRTARARQINTAAAVAAANSRLESVYDLDREGDHQVGGGAVGGGVSGVPGGCGSEEQSAAGTGASARDASGPHLQAGCEQAGSAAAAAGEFADGNAEKGNPGGAGAADGGAGEVSPKSRVVKLETSSASSTVSKSRSMMSKAHGHHHGGGKGKGPTRDRRKLREKRRSTGVVHLASTESTGGSTTGDDEESSDAVQGVSAETKRNTQHNESLISNSYKRARDKLNLSDEDSAKEAPGGSPSASLLPPSTAIHLRGSVTGGRAVPSRAKSPSDLEADDENDHDSLNQSGAEGAEGQGSSGHIPGLLPGNGTDGNGGSGAGGFTESSSAAAAAGSAVEQQLLLQQQSTNSSTPVVRPTTPIGTIDGTHVSPTRVDRVMEENKRLLSLMEEKDRKIHLLEFKIEQLMKDTKTIVEDQSRLQVENTTLLKALSVLDKKQHQDAKGEDK